MIMDILGRTLFTSLFLGAGIIVLLKNLYVIRNGTRTIARIVSFREKWINRSEEPPIIERIPIVEFIDNEGKKIRAEVSILKWKIGDNVEIMYSNKKSSKIIAQSFFQTYILPLILIGIGIFAMIVFLLPVL